MKTFTDREIARLAAWLEEQRDFVFLDTSRLSEEDRYSYLFLHPLRWLTCEGPEKVDFFVREIKALQQQGYFLAGWFSYEFGYLLEPSLARLWERKTEPAAVIGVFDSPIVFDHQRDNMDLVRSITGEQAAPGHEYSVRGIRPNITRQEHRQALDRIREYQAAGDTYQVNYTFKLLFTLEGRLSSFYLALRRNQSVSYGAWIRQGTRDIMSFSPELFFRAAGDRVTVKPMKGTMARGRTALEDIPRRKALQEDVKNLSENVMIVDLLRNDLGCLLHNSGGGEVRPRSLFDVEIYETVLQMTSTIDGFHKAGQCPDVHEIMRALFPCGSVTGAPKIRTMEIIHELEKKPRGVYCGAIGFSNNRQAVFNVPIRTVDLEDGKGEMGVGSGIVYDSDPGAEWDECLLKGEFFARPQPPFQLIETLLWQPGSGYWLLNEHLERLSDSAAYFFFQYDRQKTIDLLLEEVRECSVSMRVRLLLDKDGTVTVSSEKLADGGNPPILPGGAQNPLKAVCFAETQTDPENVHLFHKTTERGMYTDERRKALARGYYEVLFVNTGGEVTEGSVTNIFIEGHGQLITPPVSSGLLAGTFRKFLLERGIAVEKILCKKDVLSAERVYVGNSVRGLVPVKVIA